MCTFLLQNSALWDMTQMHSGICEMGLLLPYIVWMVMHQPCILYEGIHVSLDKNTWMNNAYI